MSMQIGLITPATFIEPKEIENLTPNKWTSIDNQKLLNAVDQYSKIWGKVFPEDPFSKHPFVELNKFCILEGLNKNPKSIREKWLNQISPKIKSTRILKEDAPLVIELYNKHPKKWLNICLEIYNLFERKCYYPENTIKNFMMRPRHDDLRESLTVQGISSSVDKLISKEKKSKIRKEKKLAKNLKIRQLEEISNSFEKKMNRQRRMQIILVKRLKKRELAETSILVEKVSSKKMRIQKNPIPNMNATITPFSSSASLKSILNQPVTHLAEKNKISIFREEEIEDLMFSESELNTLVEDSTVMERFMNSSNVVSFIRNPTPVISELIPMVSDDELEVPVVSDDEENPPFNELEEGVLFTQEEYDWFTTNF